jgi:hypothetical protein
VKIRARLIGAGLAALLGAGCAMARNTAEQDLGYQRWSGCVAATENLIQIERVDPDGRIWYSAHGTADRWGLLECLEAANRLGPRLPEPLLIHVPRGR